MPVSPTRQFRLLTLHCAGAQGATSLAGGFVGAYLMKIGLGLPEALCVYAAILAMRFALRLAVLPLVRRIGLRRALVLGIAVNALQFWPLAQAGDLRWLIAWIGVVALSESLYWPILHAASSVTTAGETRGRQIAARQAATGLIAVVAPLLGGFILPRFGPAADFGVAAGLLLLWWDLGAIGGCLAGAATAALTVVPSLAILPASLGVAAMAACMRDRPARGDGLALAEEAVPA